jgi:putative aldouronate transport system permease protein
VAVKTIGRIARSYQLYLLLLPALLYYLLFHYWPIYGLQIAFRDFSAALGIFWKPLGRV